MRPLTAALCCAMLAAVPGCGDDDSSSDGGGMTIDWDLSASHTIEDVNWPRDDLSAVVLDPVDSVSIRLPEGRRFEGDGELVHDVSLERRGRTVQTVQIDSHPTPDDDVYRLAVRWAEEWDLPTEPLAAWREDGDSTVQTSVSESGRIGPKGPVPTVQIRPADDGGRASLQFFWPA
jgi:hypothetical protein